MPKGTKVLMADDDKMLIDMYKERLELAGYLVTICRNGEEALAKVREAKPDIILLDIMMPKINGYETLASLKSDPKTKDIPVVMLSALMRDFNREKAVEAGAEDYIIKSEAMPADVITKIEQILIKYGAPISPTPGPITSSVNTIESPSQPITAAITPEIKPTPNVVAPIPAVHVATTVATPIPAVMQPDAEVKDEPAHIDAQITGQQNPENILFEPAVTAVPAQPTTVPMAHMGEDAFQDVKKEDEVPVVKLDNKPEQTAPIEITSSLKLPTMAWEAEPGLDKLDKAVQTKKEKSPASIALIVVLTILLTSLINDIAIYFFFFANK